MIQELRIDEIVPNPNQPRKHFDEETLKELAASIVADGLQSPILVRPKGDKYEIVQGERRYRAHIIAGLETIKAEIKEMNDEDAFHLSVIENIQREQLTPIEEAQAFLKYVELGYTHEEIAKKVSKTRDYVTSKLRLLKLSEPIQNMISRGEIKEGHAKQLLRLKGILDRICTEKYNPVIARHDLFEFFQDKFCRHFWDKNPITVNDVKKWVDQWYYMIVFTSIRQALGFGSVVIFDYGHDRLKARISVEMFSFLYGNKFENLTESDFDFAAEFEKELLKHSYDRNFRKWTIDRFYDSVRFKENPFNQQSIEWIKPTNYNFVMLLEAAVNGRMDEEGNLETLDNVERYKNFIDEINASKNLKEDVVIMLFQFYLNHSSAEISPNAIKEFYECDRLMVESGFDDFNEMVDCVCMLKDLS